MLTESELDFIETERQNAIRKMFISIHEFPRDYRRNIGLKAFNYNAKFTKHLPSLMLLLSQCLSQRGLYPFPAAPYIGISTHKIIKAIDELQVPILRNELTMFDSKYENIKERLEAWKGFHYELLVRIQNIAATLECTNFNRAWLPPPNPDLADEWLPPGV